MNDSRSRTIILITGLAVVLLAAGLFVHAMSIADFGGGWLSGRSNVRLLAAFALLAGLALALLAVIAKGRPVAASAAATGPAAPPPAAPVETAAPEADDRAVDTAPAEPAAIIAETAGELRTTVDAIQEELEDILEEEVPADKEHVQAVYDETDRLKKIIASMELLSRVQDLARSPRKETLMIASLLAGVVEATRQAVTDREVAYRVECEEGLAVSGDRECLGIILGNIADNAARAVRGSGSVTLGASRKGDRIAFTVTDTGPGIRKAHRAHIYERFFRGSGSGIGMGLAVAKELVDACGGTIGVETAANKGTTFTVLLPAE